MAADAEPLATPTVLPRPLPPPPRGRRGRRRGERVTITRRTQQAPPPQEEQPLDYTNAGAVYSTGGGPAEMYHFHREPTYHHQYAEAMAAEEQQKQANTG